MLNVKLTEHERNDLAVLSDMLAMREEYYRKTTLRSRTADQFAAWRATVDKVRMAKEVMA